MDIDNVIAASDVVMRDVIREVTGGRVALAYEDVVEFDYTRCGDAAANRITEAEWTEVHLRFSSPSRIKSIPVLPGAVEGVRALAARGVLHVATSRLVEARRGTVEWLEENNVRPHELHFVRHRAKHESLRQFTVAVEDDYDQAVSFAKHGTRCILLRRPWNEGRPCHDDVQWVGSWEEVVREALRAEGAEEGEEDCPS